MAEWHTLESARTEWDDAPLDDDQLEELLEVAKDAVLAYAPALPEVLAPVIPDPVTVDVNTGGVIGTIILTRLPDDVLELDLDLDTAAGTGDYWEVPITTNPALLAVENQLFWSLTDGPTLEYQANGALGRRYGDWPADDAIDVRVYATARESLEPVVNIPTRYRVAQLMQARNVWNSSSVSTAGDFDSGSYGLTTHPLDWQIKQILRPQTIFGGAVG